MPFYEYVCTECGAATELLQKLSDPPATTCPTCHAQALTKQISAAGFRLKGGGWYETDFKSDGQRNLAKAGGDAAPAESAKSEASAEGKGGHIHSADCSHGTAETTPAAKPEGKAQVESKPAATPKSTTPAATPAP